MKFFKKICLSLALMMQLAVFSSLYVPIAFAQTSGSNVANPPTTAEYKGGEASIRTYLCTPTDLKDKPEGGNQDLYDCVNRLYRFGIAIGAAASVLLFVIAGYLYMTGEQKGIEQAKSIVSSTLVGMGLLLGTFVLLNQISPELVKFKPLELPKPENVIARLPTPDELDLDDPDFPVLHTAPGANPNAGGGRGGKAYPEFDCKNGGCLNLGDKENGSIQCKNSCKVQEGLAKGLKIAKAYTDERKVDWYISEAWPPSSNHQNSCHSTGACVDMNVSVRSTANYIILCEGLKKGNLNIFNEAINYPATGNSVCGPIHKTKYATGDHLHVSY